jgi:hypothetical protein
LIITDKHWKAIKIRIGSGAILRLLPKKWSEQYLDTNSGLISMALSEPYLIPADMPNSEALSGDTSRNCVPRYQIPAILKRENKGKCKI